MKKWIKFILIPLGFLVFIGALVLLHNQLKNLSYNDIINALRAIPVIRIFIAMCLAFSYYILLGGYDIVAFKYIGAKVPLHPKDILFTCFVSNVLGSNTGYSMLFGGSIRYRLYSIHNVSMVDVTKVLFFSSATIWLGLLAVGGVIFTIAPVSLSSVTQFSFSTRGIGIFFLAVLTVYICLSAFRFNPVKIFKWKVSFPNIKIVISQIILATADWIIASLTLYMLMPAGEIPYFVLLKVFLVSQLLGIISQVPGGMGIFEVAINGLLPNAAGNPGVIGGLLAYRAIFYFFPLGVALFMLASYEIVRVVRKIDEKTRIFGKNISSLVVQVLAVSVFFAGMTAIFATSTPFNVEQLKMIINLFPPWLANLSHFLLSTTSAGLLFLSRAIQLRIKNAYKWTAVFLITAIICMIVVGENVVVLAVFIMLFTALLFSKKYFYRDISILNTAFSASWFSAIGGVFALSAGIGFFVNKYAVFSWVHFGVFYQNLFSDSDSARFSRATLGIVVIFIIVAVEQIFRNFFKKPVVFDKKDIERIVASSDYTYAYAALSADKNYMVSDEKDAFLMYAPSGNSWIVLGDPVGKFSGKNELLWKFKEMTDKKSVKPAFIGIEKKYVQIYDDIGLDVFYAGQEGKVALRTFKGGKYFEDLAASVEKNGFTYKTVKAADFEKYRQTFARINALWEKNSHYMERSFIPGNYDESYMRFMDFSILEKDGQVCAFSVLTAAKSKYEISSNIVRHLNCTDEVFAYILYKNIMLAKENGYKWFDLGLAYFPAVDSENDMIKHFAKMFTFAEHFNYNIKALREFKEQFAPKWHKKYVAIHPDKYILMFVKNFTALISPRKTAGKRQFFKRFFRR
ncbi:MAG: phosphatidylglycerol lysyltransferase domain-containing protein [Endomicrobium sp.]|jgi:phosphatidylglycerol lysyltransferase|nr:phosphatidylglycerol lysyltransferase domain-containing protein [Endomicrobium sp.]